MDYVSWDTVSWLASFGDLPTAADVQNQAPNAAAYSAQWKVYMARLFGLVIYTIDRKSFAITTVHNVHILSQIGKEM
jgi:hypothetical protein